MKIDTTILQSIQNEIDKAKKIAVLGHHHPDGDSMGGSGAVYTFLKNMGKEVGLLMPSQFSPSLAWMPNVGEIIRYDLDKNAFEKSINEADLVFCVDYNEAGRTGAAEAVLKNSPATKIVLDHHPNSGSYGNYIICETSVSSASEVVYEVLSKLNNAEKYICKTVAENLFTGIMTDTICFSVNSSRPRTFEIAAKLLKFGLDKDKIYGNVNFNFSEQRMRLMGFILDSKMNILPEYNLAYAVLSLKDQEKYNYKHGDAEGLVNLPLSIKGVDASVLFIEKEDYVKLSLRSTNDFDVNKLARLHFNGGGHQRAAGGKLDDISGEAATALLLKVLPDFYADYKGQK